MHIKLLHIIILMNVVWCVSSCSSQDSAEEDLGDGREVKFVVSDMSRASSTTDVGYTGSRFAIFGDMKFRDNPPITIFDNTIVRYSDGNWVYDNTQYWFPKHEHSFIAIHPSGIKHVSYSNSTLSFTYTVPDDFANTSDILAATHRRMYNDDSSVQPLPVKLVFFHTMSRINFQLTNAGAAEIVKVNEVKLMGINKTGTFTITPATLASGSGQTEDCIFSWTDISNTGDLTAKIDVDVPEEKARFLFPDNNALLVIPQPENKGVFMKITCTLIEEGMEDRQLEFTAETPVGGWESGKEYTYSTAVHEVTKDISLTVSVKDWHKPKDNSVTVPEY